MMSLPPTTLLMLCLLAATLLGGGIGACLWHLRSGTRFERALDESRRHADAEREALHAMLGDERELGEIRHVEMRGIVAQAREQAERARARNDALAVHAREQGRRVEALEAEVVAYEAWRSRLGRETEDASSERRRESLDDTPDGAARGECDLPVLNRRVRGDRSAPRPATRPVARTERVAEREPSPDLSPGGDLDIPTLCESELPEAADDRALGLLDTRTRLPGVDEQ